MKSKRYILCTALTVVSALMAVVPAQAQMPSDTTLVDMPFRKVAKKDIMGGVASVNVRQLTDKNYTTYSLDNMNGMVSGFNGAGMWGYTGQLILVDGVPREATTIRSEEIESITFLKGAQAVALYGSRAAQGAILITSKRGRVNKGLDIDVRLNTDTGVFGKMSAIPDGTPIGIALKNKVKEGNVKILCTVDGEGVREYDAQITCILSRESDTKNFIVRITDKELLAKTGGIVQGMSGSPIIRNGMLIGAITHVLVNDPTRGYGIFIENMLAAERDAA